MGVQCDRCLVTVAPEASAGWLMLARVTRPKSLAEQMMPATWLSATPEPTPDPLETLRHFCTADCLVGYVNSGLRDLYHQVPAPGV